MADGSAPAGQPVISVWDAGRRAGPRGPLPGPSVVSLGNARQIGLGVQGYIRDI